MKSLAFVRLPKMDLISYIDKKIKRIKNIGKGTITVTLPKDMELEKAELDLKAGELRAEQILAKDLEVNAGAGEVNILEFAAEKAEFKCGLVP